MLVQWHSRRKKGWQKFFNYKNMVTKVKLSVEFSVKEYLGQGEISSTTLFHVILDDPITDITCLLKGYAYSTEIWKRYI